MSDSCCVGCYHTGGARETGDRRQEKGRGDKCGGTNLGFRRVPLKTFVAKHGEWIVNNVAYSRVAAALAAPVHPVFLSLCRARHGQSCLSPGKQCSGTPCCRDAVVFPSPRSNGVDGSKKFKNSSRKTSIGPLDHGRGAGVKCAHGESLYPTHTPCSTSNFQRAGRDV